MWALVRQGKVQQVFEQARAFKCHAMVDVPVKKIVTDPADKTWRLERRKQREIEVTETVREMDELQYPANIFTRWTPAELKAIGILPLAIEDQPNPETHRSTGYEYEIQPDRVIRKHTTETHKPEVVNAVAARLQSRKVRQSKMLAERAIAAGIPWEGDVVQIDERSRAAMAEQLQRFALFGETPVAWRMASNRDMTLNVEQFRRMYGAALKRADEARAEDLARRAAIDRAAGAGIEALLAHKVAAAMAADAGDPTPLGGSRPSM